MRKLKEAIVISFFMILSYFFAMVFGSMIRPGPVFIGSPNVYLAKIRNDLDLTDDGVLFNRFVRSVYLVSKPLNPWEKWTPLVDTLIEVEGIILPGMKIAKDGDIHFRIRLLSDYVQYGSVSVYSNSSDEIVCEINRNLRPNFSILPYLAIGDLVRIRGEWVRDNHDNDRYHYEIHPIYWIEIIKPSSE